jgi:hypothetical protein
LADLTRLKRLLIQPVTKASRRLTTEEIRNG